jgi:hypothetical protein
MAAKRSSKASHIKSKNDRQQTASQPPAMTRSLLALTLVPLVAGVLLLAAWAFNITVWGSPQAQLVVSGLFIFFSFAASNALQKKWFLACGWALLMVGDWLLWTFTTTSLQITSFIVGGLGLIILGFEYFRRIGERGMARKS